MIEALALAIGYLLGCVLPAYLIGRARGIDLRTVGERNAGTSNALRELGRGPAIVTGLYDVLKGPLAIAAAWQSGADERAVWAAGLLTIVGHRYPFYLRFKGARGFATASGLLVFAVGYSEFHGWLTPLDAMILVGLYLALMLVFQDRGVPNALVVPAGYAVIAYRSDSTSFDVCLGLVVAYVWAYNAARVRAEHLLRLKPETRKALGEVRVLLRPGALAFPVLYLFVGKTPLLMLIGTVALFFLTVDVSRLLWRRFNIALFRRMAFFYRPNEEHAFTSATLFLLGTFLTVFLFPKPEATMALVFVTFGDLAAKYAGLEHGRTRVFARTLEGSVAYFLACAVAGFAWSRVVPLEHSIYILGALAASLTEALPWDLNDNFTVPLMSATAMVLPAFLRNAI